MVMDDWFRWTYDRREYDFKLKEPEPTPILKNALVVPYWVYSNKIKIIGEKYVPDDRIYFVDSKGNMHCFANLKADHETK